MSEYVGEAFVKITPDARGFKPELDKQIASQTSRAPLAQRSGIDKDLKDVTRLENELAASKREESAAQDRLTTATNKGAQAHENYSVHAHRASIAGFGVRASTIALGAGALIGAEGLRELGSQLKVTGDRADTLTGGLRNAAAAALSGDFASAAKNLGTGLGAGVNPEATGELQAANARVTQVETAIATAKEILDLREKLSKTEGQIGTQAGVQRFELEKQLRIAQGTFNTFGERTRRTAAGQFGLAPDLGNKVAIAATDATRQSDFQLAALRAAQTDDLKKQREILQTRDKGLRGQISYLEQAGAHTQAAKDRLATLYGQLEGVEGQITALDEQAAQKKAARIQRQFDIASAQIGLQAANARTDSQEIAALNADAALNRKTANQKGIDKLAQLGYLTQAATDDKQISSIQEAAAAAASAAAKAAKDAADEKKRQLEQDRKEAEARAAQARATIRSTGELRLENAIASAALTKSTADDKKAINVAISYYRNLVRTTRGLQQEQARAQVIALRGQLKSVGTNDSNAPRSSASDFFREAASQFRSFGSNISTAGGILSGQDARGAFAARALQSGGIAQTMAAQAQQTRNASLVEAQKSNVYLKTIADRLTYSGAEKDPPAKAIGKARRGAHTVQAAV